MADLAADALYRTVCANGKEHATFAVGDAARVPKRARQVCDYDDGHGCGPHTAEVSNDGMTWKVIER
jgi:hypothetical protein